MIKYDWAYTYEIGASLPLQGTQTSRRRAAYSRRRRTLGAQNSGEGTTLIFRAISCFTRLGGFSFSISDKEYKEWD